jgi:fibronectin type 3 domain-containing protein
MKMRATQPIQRGILALAFASAIFAGGGLPAAGVNEVAQPQPVAATALAVTMREVRLFWTPMAGQYDIWRDGRRVAVIPATEGGYIDTNVQPGRNYAYAVSIATNAPGGPTGATRNNLTITTPVMPDEPDTVAPTKPDDFTANPRPGYILLDWYASHDNTDVTVYVVRRDGQSLAMVHASQLEYHDTTVRPGMDYSYSIHAIDASGNQSSVATTESVRAITGYQSFFPFVAQSGDSTSSTPVSRTAVTAYSPNLRRYPYLTDLVAGFATFNWATDNTVSVGAVTYGRVGSEPCTANSVTATRNTVYVNAVTTYQWRAQVALQPNTQYCYRVYGGAGNSNDLLGSDPSPQFWTQVPLGDNTPYSFAVIGDWGDAANAGSAQATLMQDIAQSGARFAVTTGDNAYPSGSQSNYGDLVQSGGNLSGVFGPQGWSLPGRSMAMFPALGNHGMSNSDTNHPHLINWPQAMVTQLSSGRYLRESYSGLDGTTTASYPSTWYAFDAGNIRFYVLKAAWADSNLGSAGDAYKVDYDYHWASSRPEYQWLAADLAANAAKPKIAVFHYPLYSDNKAEKSDTFLRGPGSLEGLLIAHNTRLIFNGHAHLYQRSVVTGVTSYVIGATGVKLQPIDNGCGSNTAYGIGWSNSKNKGYACGAASVPTSKLQVHSYALVTVEGSTVTVSPRNALGQTFDTQVYDFGTSSSDTTPPSAPVTLDAVAAGAARVDLAWAESTDNIAVTGHDLERNGAIVASIGALLSYSDATVAPASSYTYRVRARDAAGNTSGWSPSAAVTTPPDTTPPSAPANLAANPASATSVALGWSASVDDVAVTGYDIARDGTPLVTLGPVTSYVDATALPATTYQYQVRARDAAGNLSAWSNTASATTPSTSLPIFEDGFESGTLAAWTSSGGLTVQSTNVQQGAFAAQGSGSATGHYAKKTLPSTYTDAYARVYFNILSYSSQVNLLRLRTANDTSIGYVFVSTSGNLSFRNDVGAVTATSASTVGMGWHALEVHMTVNGAASTVEVWLDGLSITDLSITTNLGTTPVGRMQIGEVQSGRTYDLLLDSAAFGTGRLGP